MTRSLKSTFVIVGGGIAGVSCAETLSYLCPTEDIILLTESSLIKTVTNIIPLGKLLTKFDVQERNVDTLTNEHVNVLIDALVSIDSENKKILTSEGRDIKYKYLCLCTGARPKLIEPNNNYVIGIRDTESVLDFQKRIQNSRKVVIVGNGGIASEIVYETRKIYVDWVIKDNFISSTFVDPGAAQFFQSHLKSKDSNSQTRNTVKRLRYSDINVSTNMKQGAALGPDWHSLINITGNLKNIPDSVNIHYKTEVVQIRQITDHPENFPLEVSLNNNVKIFCDFLVSATGVNPQINFQCDRDFVLGPDGAINVNELMETNIHGVFAAGDICFAGWKHAQHWFQMRLWSQARNMGTMAAKSMAATLNGEVTDQDFCFELFAHVTSLFGYQVVLLGKYNGQGLGTDYEILLRSTPEKEYIKFVLKDGKLQGAILIGETGLEETCENLILNQLDLTPFGDDILNPDIDIEDYFD